jgi:hypothetical protein
MTEEEIERNELSRDVLIVEDGWRISRKNRIICLGCTTCMTCACGGQCYQCNAEAPTKMVGMLKMIRWGNEEK